MVADIEDLKVLDKPLTINQTLKFINSYNYNRGVFCQSNYLSLQCFELLVQLVNYYNDTGNGISITKLLYYSSFSKAYYHKIYSMMETLSNRGFVEYIGNGVNKSKLFAPTDKAVSSIISLVSSIT